MSLHLSAADPVVALGAVTGLVGLWLRLRWRTRQEHARRKTLVRLTRCLRPGSELVEHAADGTRLRITVDHPGPGDVAPIDGRHVGGGCDPRTRADAHRGRRRRRHPRRGTAGRPQ